MKKLTAISSVISTYLILTSTTLAQNLQITKPEAGYATIQAFLNAALRLAFIIALLIVLVMLVWGAVQWILSGGDSEAIEAARNRIIHALVGLAILAVAFALVNLAGTFVGINLLGNFTIPTPVEPTPAIPVPTRGGSV